MKLLVTIEIPQEASLADLNDVIEFVNGMGQAELHLSSLKMTVLVEPSDQPSMDLSAALVNHVAQEIETVVAPLSIHARVREAISAGFGFLDRWDEIATEVRSRGWVRPSWEIRA
jgi:hypothetical protein